MPAAIVADSVAGRRGGPARRQRAPGRGRRLVPLVVMGMLLALALAGPARAQTAPVVADRYDVDLTVQTDGSLAVVEQLALDFAGGPFRHGYREISLARVDAIADVQVSEPGRPYTAGQESPYTFTAHRDGNRLRIDWWFPPTTNAHRTFEIRYRAEGVVRIYPGGDQIYWTAIPPDLEYPVRAATVLVHTPGDAERAAAYPERENVAISQVDPQTMRFDAANLAPGHDLVVRVQFPHGLVPDQPPAWQAAADREDWLMQNVRPVLNFILLLLTLLIAVGGLAALGVLWTLRGRDPSVKAGARVLETPPSDLPAPMVGTLLDERADQRDLVAALVDLANRGVVRIAPLTEAAPLPGWTADYEIARLTNDTSGLRNYEQQLLSQLLGEDTRTRLSAARQRFAAALPYLQEALAEDVARAGLFYENPAHARKRYLRSGILLLVLAAGGGIFFGGWLTAYTDLAFLPFLAVGLLGGVTLWLSGHMARRTRAGALAADRWRAFARYLRQLAPGTTNGAAGDVFERYLPYAIVFGLDKSWIERFAAAGAAAPAWYGGSPIGGPPIVVGGPGWYGGPVWYPGPGAPSGGGPQPGPGPAPDHGMPAGRSMEGGLQGMSDSLADMLNRASDVFASGMGSSHGGHDWTSGGWGGSDWSGGGAGDFGGGSGASGGGGGGFS